MDQRKKAGTLCIVGIFAVIGMTSVSARGQVVDYFNGYGTTTTAINGLNGGTGWSGAWSGAGGTDTTSFPRYVAGTQLSYSGANYSNPGNTSTTTDGLAMGGTSGALFGTKIGYIDYRPLSTGINTGTIWISALVNISANGGGALISLGSSTTNTNYIALRGDVGSSTASTTGPSAGIDGIPEAYVKYSGTGDGSNNISYATGTTHLLIAEVGMNYSGTSDSLAFWVDPTLGATGPTSTANYTKNGADAFGTTFSGIGIGIGFAGDSLDSLRISNSTTGYQDVTGATPEPGSVILAGIAVVGFSLRRRDRRCQSNS